MGARERRVFERGDDGGEEVAKRVGVVREGRERAELFGVQRGVGGCIGEAAGGVSR